MLLQQLAWETHQEHVRKAIGRRMVNYQRRARCEYGVDRRGYRPPCVTQSTLMVSGITLDPHPVIKEADMMEYATSSTARPHLHIGLSYRGVNEV